MKSPKHTSWDDVLFENRNKAYGAYDLRKNENFNLLKSLFAGILFVGIGIAIFSFTNSSKDDKTNTGFYCPVIVELDNVNDVVPVKPIEKTATKVVHVVDKKIEKDIIPEPTESPTIETPVTDNRDLGTLVMPETDGDNNGSIISGSNGNSNNSNNDDSGNGVEIPTETKTTFTVRDVRYMAVFPGCEKFSNDKLKSQECFSKKLQDELGSQLDEFGETANARNIAQAVAKLQFVVNKSGEIVQVKALNGGNAELSKESKEAMERISRKFIQKGKLLKPAKLDDGTPVNMLFTIPVKYTSN